ncbi:MAG: 3-phosphoshikimate 1-carboxyvinyltransferase [Acidimicrobiia bacterium]
MRDPLPIEPLAHPPDATVEVPGSKSITNRALICAALADGPSTIRGALVADDTEAMATCLRSLGVVVDWTNEAVLVRPQRPFSAGVTLDARLSGTTARFILPLAALDRGTRVVDGDAPLRARPMGETAAALRTLGANVEGDRLPIVVEGPLRGGEVSVAGDASSQFLSGLLLAGPAMPEGLSVELSTALVSRPYVDMTLAVMRSFGASVDGFAVEPTSYRPSSYEVEPDASAASYFFAAAAATGGRVTVRGLGSGSMQGDLQFLGVLEQMGCRVERGAGSTTVTGPQRLRGVEVDMRDMSDTAQTLAAIAPLASSPTRVTGIGFIRRKETDRIAAVVAELHRCGVTVEEEHDGFVVHPGEPEPAVIETYRDHRMAMSFAVLGLVVPGISIADPGCVDKTFPDFFDRLETLR